MAGIDLSTTGLAGELSTGKPAITIPEDWSDQDFREAFESLEVPNEMFHHREHIRMAWIYACHFSREEAFSRMAGGIQAFAKHHGATNKYHHTITVAWMRLVWHAARSEPPASDFRTFAIGQPQLLNPRLLDDFYSKARLESDAARQAWMEPDLRSMP